MAQLDTQIWRWEKALITKEKQARIQKEMEILLPLPSKAEGGQWLTKGGEGPANGKPISFKSSCSAHVLCTIPTGTQSLWEKQDEAGCTPNLGCSRLSMSQA